MIEDSVIITYLVIIFENKRNNWHTELLLLISLVFCYFVRIHKVTNVVGYSFFYYLIIIITNITIKKIKKKPWQPIVYCILYLRYYYYRYSFFFCFITTVTFDRKLLIRRISFFLSLFVIFFCSILNSVNFQNYAVAHLSIRKLRQFPVKSEVMRFKW